MFLTFDPKAALEQFLPTHPKEMCQNAACGCVSQAGSRHCGCGPGCRCNVVTLTVVTKGRQHPFFGQGSKFCFAWTAGGVTHLNGETLEVRLGSKILIEHRSAEHPFYLSSTPEGAGKGLALTPRIVVPTLLAFDNPDAFPETVWASCAFHPYMGFPVHILKP